MSSADGIHPVATSPLAKLNEARAIAILIDSDPHFTPRAPLAGMFAKFLVHTPLETVYIGCPEQALVLARSGDHGDYENIFLRKIVLAL